MKKLFTIFALLICIISNAQNFVWARSFGSAGTGIFSQSYDGANEIATDPSGNIIVAGTFNGTVDFDPSIFVSNLTSAGNDDVFIAKYNSSGNFVWVKQLGNTNQDNITDLKCDATGNIYFTGNFSGTVDFNPSAAVLNLTAIGGSDIYAVKYDNNGNLSYAKAMGGTSGDYGWALDIDNTGALYLSGSFNGTADFDPSAATYTLTSNGLQDVFVTKLSNTGTFVWASKMGGPASDSPGDIALNTAQNLLYMVCTFSNTITNGVTTFTSAGKQDVYMQRIPAASGGLNAAKTYGGTDNEYVSDLTIDANDNMYLTGSFAGLGDFDPSPAVAQLVVQTTGDNDAYLSKLSSNFVFSWVKQIESTSTDGGNKIKLDSDNNIYWLGYFTGPDTDLDPSVAGTYTVTNNGGSNQDAFLIKFDPSANYVWGKNWGNASGINAPALALDFQNNIFACGDYFGTCDFDPDPINSYSLTANVYGTDAYMFKLSCTLPTTVNTTSNIIPICIGSNTTKTISISSTIENGVTYSWSSVGSTGVSFSPTSGTNTSISYTANTSFSVVVTATNACGTTTTMVQAITPYALPTLSVSIAPSATICSGDPASFTATGASSYTWNPAYIMNGSPTIHFTGGIFTVTATDANACVNTKTVSFTVLNNPTIAVSGQSISCLNSTHQLTASGANTYTWMPGAVLNSTINAQPLGNTTYTVNAKDINGCSGSTTFSLNIVTPETPEICEVTVDSLSQFNNIMWDKTAYTNVDSFIVYREVSTNIYKRIGAQDKNAFSLFVDTARSVGPANGDPNITSYRYKLQLRDTCGNYSALSPYHNTVYFITNTTGTFFWNTYNIEFQPSTPVSTFELVRDNNATGTWTLVGTSAGTSTSLNDPAYLSYPLAIYRVLANGLNCNPTLKATQQINKTKSNVKNNYNLIPTSIKTNVLNTSFNIAPNPATSELTVSFGTNITSSIKIIIAGVLGEVVSNYELNEGNTIVIPVNELANGVYFVKLIQGKNYTVKKFIKE